MKTKKIKVRDISNQDGQLVEINPRELTPLLPPYDTWVEKPMATLTDDQKSRKESGLDGFAGIGIPKPKSIEEFLEKHNNKVKKGS